VKSQGILSPRGGKVAALKSEQRCPTGLVDFYSKTKLYCSLIIVLMKNYRISYRPCALWRAKC